MADPTQPKPGPAFQDEPASGTPAAKQQATDVAASAKDHAAGVASTATDQAKTVADQARSEAKVVLDDARQQLRTQAGEQSQKLSSALGDLGNQLREMAEGRGGSGVARDVVASLAEQAEQVSRRLGDGDIDRTLDDARRWARNRPGLFLGVAAAAGFVIARVARSADTDSLKQAASPSSDDSGSPEYLLGTEAHLSSTSPVGVVASEPLGGGFDAGVTPTIGGGAAQ